MEFRVCRFKSSGTATRSPPHITFIALLRQRPPPSRSPAAAEKCVVHAAWDSLLTANRSLNVRGAVRITTRIIGNMARAAKNAITRQRGLRGSRKRWSDVYAHDGHA